MMTEISDGYVPVESVAWHVALPEKLASTLCIQPPKNSTYWGCGVIGSAWYVPNDYLIRLNNIV
jgi:hypothetical protein